MKKFKPFSKKLLILDYAIAVILLVCLFVCLIANGVYSYNMSQELIISGIDVSSIAQPFDLGTLSIVIGTWVAQLGISSGAYYMLAKSEHKIELPMRLINELPDDIKDKVNMTELITTVLNTTDN